MSYEFSKNLDMQPVPGFVEKVSCMRLTGTLPFLAKIISFQYFKHGKKQSHTHT